MMVSRKIGFVGLAGALALAIAGCGGSAVSHAPKPTPKSSAKAPVSSGLTLAEASSPSHQVQFPVVPCNTQGTYGQAWESSGLLAGSPVAECPPTDFLTKLVPTVVPVMNNDPTQFTQAQADALGRALMVTFAWSNWASYGDTPAMLTTIGQGTGPDAPYLQMILNGFRAYGLSHGNGYYPSSITLIPLSGNESSLMADPAAKFALVVSYPQVGYEFQSNYPGKPITTTKAAPRAPGIYDGTIAVSTELGTYFAVATFASNCSVGPVAGLCASAGAN